MPKDSSQPPSINPTAAALAAPAAAPEHVEVDRLLDQMDRVFRAEAWHGASLLQLLAPVTAATAVRRPLPSRHSIWELTTHITAWIDIARERLAGEWVDVTHEMDWPAVPQEPADAVSGLERAWRETVGGLERAWIALETNVRTLDDRSLRRRVKGCPYTAYILVHGVIQHLVYHAGQIALLS